jgi:hypothetical protein
MWNWKHKRISKQAMAYLDELLEHERQQARERARTQVLIDLAALEREPVG